MTNSFPINGQKGFSLYEIGWSKTLLILSIILNLTGLFTIIMGPDGALYASIAKTMAQQNDFINLFSEGKDWLDKPHFPFWVTAVSFKIFGFHSWSYKLPAIIFLMIGARYTYLLAKNLYNREVALWSAIILLTAEHIVISNNDVRAEPFLTGLVIASVYHFYKTSSKTKIKHLIAGSLFAALAVMTKGIFALVPICAAIGGGLIINKEWKKLFHFRWMLALFLILIFIAPELFCLYSQFDRHPEKIIFGNTHVSGVKFFFWDSQFGRFMNTGPIHGKGSILFFFHTLLWAFLPWAVLLYASVFRKIRSFFRMPATRSNEEWFTISGVIITFLLFSFSKFQLPYYTNIIFPFFSIIVADYILTTSSFSTKKNIKLVQLSLVGLMILGGTLVQLFFHPAAWVWWILIFSAWFIAFAYSSRSKTTRMVLKTSIATALTAILLNLYLNIIFYPALLKYQAGSEAAFYLNKNYSREKVLGYTDRWQPDLEFYLHAPLIPLSYLEMKQNSFSGNHYLFISADRIGEVGVPYRIIKGFKGFRISMITWNFFNKGIRNEELQEYWLIQI